MGLGAGPALGVSDGGAGDGSETMDNSSSPSGANDQTRGAAHRPLALIAARARNGVIGRAGALPWRLGSDLAYFKRATLGKPVVMGRKTWESLGRPLPGRPNLVISRQADFRAEGAAVFTDLTAAVDEAERFAPASEGQYPRDIMIIGGAQLYAQALPSAQRVHLTEVDADIPGDAHFPAFDEGAWCETERTDHPAGPKDEYPFTIRVLERRC